MKIIQLNQSDSRGGAAIAAYRIHRCLLGEELDSRLWVDKKFLDDETVRKPDRGWGHLRRRMRVRAAKRIRRKLDTQNPVLHSPSWLNSNWPERINSDSQCDVVNMHWVCKEMLSIDDISRITKPLVWTLHDMWAFCGAEHYTQGERWANGYTDSNRPDYESGFDLNRWVWERKKKLWDKPIHIVTPSRWLAQCVKRRALMRGWPVTVIPNTMDLEEWRPVNKFVAREALGLSPDKPLILFGAENGIKDVRKGFDLLTSALGYLQEHKLGQEVMVFGGSKSAEAPDLGCKAHYFGRLHENESLRLLYSAADVLICPSRQEVFGQTASEAQACGTPAVAFAGTGLEDVIDHRVTGYLARPGDAQDMAQGIKWLLSEQTRCRDAKISDVSRQARNKVCRDFSYEAVAKQYKELYPLVIDQQRA